MLTRQADAQGLCKRVLGLEAPRQETQACIGFERGKCKGVRRARGADEPSCPPAGWLVASSLSGLAVVRPGHDQGPDWAPALHVFDRWAYLGTIHDMAELPELARNRVPASIRRWSS